MPRAQQSAKSPAGSINAPLIVVDNFLPHALATAMRADIDAHFARPEAHRGETHQVWNYWFVPELYTYLRTTPERVIAHDRVTAFHTILREWATNHIGMAEVTWPYLSLYVSGCRQGWHNDSRNGRFGFVYSLTRDERRTIGGETFVAHEGDAFRQHLTEATAGSGFYEVVEPRFNRLLIFDDRLPHAVERVDGSMDPTEGRFVLHGHLREGSAIVVGALQASEIAETLNAALIQFAAARTAGIALCHGPLVLRLTIDVSGSVASCDVMVDRVVHSDAGNIEWQQEIRGQLIERLKALRFAAASGTTVLIQPISFAGGMPAMV
jgi:Rps23 Pro-64 3,4-dihydroxylase Tpa1-like proline 4-hydroxylase